MSGCGESDPAEVAGHSATRVPWATALCGSLLFVLLLTGCIWVYLVVAGSGGATDLDRSVLDQMIQLRTPESQAAVTAFTDLGSLVPMLILGTTLTLAVGWQYQRWDVIVLMLIASGVSVAFTEIGKIVFGRNRPPLSEAVAPYEHNFSFPSGHTLNSTVVAGMLAYFVVWLSVSRWARIAAVAGAVLWAFFMGLSRVFLGHHWLTDVVFGWLVGLAWLTLLITVHQVRLHLRPADSASSPELSRAHRPLREPDSDQVGSAESKITSPEKSPGFPTQTGDR